MKILATIPVYFPSTDRFNIVIQRIIEQCDLILIYNSPIHRQFKCNENIHVIENTENMGIANAYNAACGFAIDNGYDYVLFLDQDSLVDKKIIETYEMILKKHKIDMLGCHIVENHLIDNSTNLKLNESFELSKHDFIISAGSLLNLEVYSRVGPFIDELFIDLVDHEYCLRITASGREIFVTGKTWVEQEFGNTTDTIFLKMIRRLLFFLFSKEFTLKRRNYNEFRIYFQFRNHVLLSKLYPYSIYNNKGF